MKKKLYLVWHRRLALIVGLPVLFWALSGILHPMMGNWFKSEIAHKFLPPKPLESQALLAPAEVIPSDTQINFLSLVNVKGRPAYLIEDQEQKFSLYNAQEGSSIDLSEYLEEKARSYTEITNDPVENIKRLDSFANDYSTINRYLPAYRVSFQDKQGLEVVIDPRTGRLARHDVPHIRVMKRLFAWFHTFSFLGGVDSLFRTIVVICFAGLGLLLGVTGIVNLFLFRTRLPSGGKRKIAKGRLAHRTVGAIAAVFYLLFGLSALFHAVMKLDYDHAPQIKNELSFTSSDLTGVPVPDGFHGPLFAVTLARIDGKPYYRSQIGREVHYANAQNGSPLVDGEQKHLGELIQVFSEELWGEVKEGTVVSQHTSFSNRYGFISRRLPVWEVSFEGHTLYLDTKDNALSKHSSALRTAEGISFSMLHKFHFIDRWNKELRDWVSATGATLVALVSCLGLLLLRKKRRAPRDHQKDSPVV